MASIRSCPDFVMLQSISHSFLIINTCTHFQNKLKQHVQEGPRQGPYRACLKFSEVEQVMKDRFPGLTNLDISRILRQAFPAVVTERSTFVIGVRRHSSSALSQSSLVNPPSLSQTITQPLQFENARLLARVHQLEQENQHLKSLTQGDSIHPSTLEEEVLQLTSSPVFVHGPDNLEGFEKFSLDVVLSEVNTLAPNLLFLFNRLAAAQRNQSDSGDEVALEGIKALVALCVLTNARSRRAKGFQLFMSTMLIACATSKQVNKK